MTNGSRADRPVRVVLLALVTALVGIVGPALAQEPNCPPNSRSPRCTSESPGGTTGGDGGDTTGDEPSQPGRSDPPPGQVKPSDAPVGAPAEPSGPRVAPPVEPDAPADQPSPPADLGAVRVLTSRVLAVAPARASLEVVVDERRAGGVDGGWSVTVEVDGAGLGDPTAVLDPASPRPGVPRAGHLNGGQAAATILTVVGQRSSQSYDASYRSAVELRTTDADRLPTITVTLFQ